MPCVPLFTAKYYIHSMSDCHWVHVPPPCVLKLFEHTIVTWLHSVTCLFMRTSSLLCTSPFRTKGRVEGSPPTYSRIGSNTHTVRTAPFKFHHLQRSKHRLLNHTVSIIDSLKKEKYASLELRHVCIQHNVLWQ